MCARSHLGPHDVDDGLRVDEGGVAEVVQATVREDLAAGLPPNSLCDGGALVVGEDLGGQAPDNTEHGPAAVHDLDLTVAAERLGVSGEACRVLHGARTMTFVDV